MLPLGRGLVSVHSYTRNQMLLQTLCDLLPTDEATRLARLDPDDPDTFVSAYFVTRRLPTMTPELKRTLMESIFDLMDMETVSIIETRRLKEARRGAGYQAPVLRRLQSLTLDR